MTGPVQRPASNSEGRKRTLHDGLPPRPWPDDSWPTADQWVAWFLSADDEQRRTIAARAIDASELGLACFVGRHDERLAMDTAAAEGRTPVGDTCPDDCQCDALTPAAPVAVEGMETVEPHAYRAEVLANPGTSRERWNRDTIEEAREDAEHLRAEGYCADQVRVAAITSTPVEPETSELEGDR